MERILRTAVPPVFDALLPGTSSEERCITTIARSPRFNRMRIVRKFGLGFLAALVPALATAQQAVNDRSGFDNSWFWGVRGGMASIDAGPGRTTAPSIGGEWFITRSKAALSLSVDHVFFDETSSVFDTTMAGGLRPVDIKDMRRYALSIFAVPVSYGGFRPYAGIGLSLNVIQNADPVGSFSDTATVDLVFDQVDRQRSRLSAAFTGGFMYQVGRAAIFGQASAMPTRDNFLLKGGSHTFIFEGGIRYNLATALDKLP